MGLDPETLRLPAQPTKVTPEASSNKKRIYVAIFDFPQISRMKLQRRTDPVQTCLPGLSGKWNTSWVGGALWKSHLTPVVEKSIWSTEDLADFGPAAFPTRVWGGRIVPEKAAMAIDGRCDVINSSGDKYAPRRLYDPRLGSTGQ